MKTNLLSLLLLLSAGTLTAQADNEQVVTVNGQKSTKTVNKLTFSGDNVVLHFADGSTQTVDMESVTIVFTVVDALKTLQTADSEEPIQYFDLQGRQLKKAPVKGSYIMKKGNRIVKLISK